MLVHLHQINQLVLQDLHLVVDILLVVVLEELKDQHTLKEVKVVVLMVETVDNKLKIIPFKVFTRPEVVEVAVVRLAVMVQKAVLES